MDGTAPLAGWGARFGFNFYKHWAQLLLCHSVIPLVTLLSQEGVTQEDTLFLFLYGVTLVPLTEELRAAYPGIIAPFYTYDAAFDGSERSSV